MGASDSQPEYNEHPSLSQQGYRVLNVQPNSPASGLGIVNWFDFIVRVELDDGRGGGEEVGEEEGDKNNKDNPHKDEKNASENASENAPENASENAPENASKNTADNTSMNASENTVQNSSENSSENTSENTSENASQSASKNASKNASSSSSSSSSSPPPPPIDCNSTSGPALMSMITYSLTHSIPLLLHVHNTKSLSLRRIPLQPKNFDGVGVLGLTIKADTYYRAFECSVKVMQVEDDGPALLAGIKSGQYLLGTERVVFDTVRTLSGCLESKVGRTLEVYFYDDGTDEVGTVVVEVGHAVMLGAEVGDGFPPTFDPRRRSSTAMMLDGDALAIENLASSVRTSIIRGKVRFLMAGMMPTVINSQATVGRRFLGRRGAAFMWGLLKGPYAILGNILIFINWVTLLLVMPGWLDSKFSYCAIPSIVFLIPNICSMN
ncbi:hypothetical protein TrRE_jg566, partial [Triparma retinervis]